MWWSHQIITIILTGTSAYGLTSTKLTNTEIEGRITYGTSATERQFPYQVRLSLIYDNIYSDLCGGSLIGAEWVLTAAHCLWGYSFVVVHMGSNVRDGSEVTRAASNHSFIIHNKYVKKSFENDIALIKIPPVALDTRLQIIKLPSISTEPHTTYANEFAFSSGWGITCWSERLPNHLQWARFKVISMEDCLKEYYDITDSYLCIDTPIGVSPSIGDSGGPLVLEKNETLIGVFILRNRMGCTLGKPAVFIRVTKYLDWIRTNTGISY